MVGQNKTFAVHIYYILVSKPRFPCRVADRGMSCGHAMKTSVGSAISAQQITHPVHLVLLLDLCSFLRFLRQPFRTQSKRRKRRV